MMFVTYCQCGKYRVETEGVNVRVRDLDQRADVVAFVMTADLGTWLKRYHPGCEMMPAGENGGER